MKELEQATRDLKAVLKMAKHRFQGMQLVSVMADTWDVGETKDLHGTLNTLVYKDETVLKFNTVIPAGGSFLPHMHEVVEQVHVIKGVLRDYLHRGEWREGDVMSYDSHVAHAPYNPSDDNCQLLVVFDRTKTKKDVQTEKV